MPDDLDAYLDPAPKPRRRNYDEIINRHAQRTGLDPELVRAVIHQESGGNPAAVSPKGARGPMQLMPGTAQRFGVTDPHDPEQAIRAGTDYLKFLNDRFQGNRDLVLAGYNAGEGAVDRYKGIPPYKETQTYVRSINARLASQSTGAQTPQRPKPDLETYLDPTPTSTPKSPALAEMEALSRQARGTPPVTPPAPAPTPESPAAPPETPPQPVTLTAHDAAWHLGLTPDEARRTVRRQRVARVLAEAVEEDNRKRAAGQQIGPPSLEYQNETRKRAGLAPLKFNLATGPGASPYYQPQAGSLPDTSPIEVPRIRTRTSEFHFQPTAEDRAQGELRRRMLADPQFFNSDEYKNFLLLNRSTDNPSMRADFVRHRTEQQMAQQGGGNAFDGGSASSILLGEEMEKGRQHRVAQMGWPEYLAQAPKSAALGATDSLATFMKSIAVLNQKMDQWTFGAYKKDTKDLPAYRIGQAIQEEARNLPGFLKSDPDLEQEMLHQSASTIGQVATFMLGGWVSKSPKLATVILGVGMTAGDAYDEVRANGGSDADAVNAGLIAGGLLGPTELFGLQGAMHAIENRAVKATWRAALKEAFKEGRRDIIENVLQEMGQEWGQGEITGKRRTEREILQAGLQGAVGGVVSIPTTAIANRPRAEARPLEAAPDITARPDEAPIKLPEEGRVITPESPATIAAQIDAMVSHRGNRMGVLIPKGQSAPTKTPKGHVATRTSEGVVIHPKELSASDVRELVDGGNTWQLLGHANPDGPEASRVVVARSTLDAANGIKAGDELMSSYVEEGQEQNAIEEMRAQFGPYEPVFEVGGSETATQVVHDRGLMDTAAGEISPRTNASQQTTLDAAGLTPPQESEGSSRFAQLSNAEIEQYIANTQRDADRRTARLTTRPPKGTAKAERQARPQIAVRQQQRAENRIAEAAAELERRRAGTDAIPSFDQYLETEAGGQAGGVNPATLTDEERSTLLRQYDEKYFGKPHHSRLQRRRQRGQRKGQFAPGKIEQPKPLAENLSKTRQTITETITKAEDGEPGTKHPKTGRKFSSTQVNLPPQVGELQKKAAAAIPESELAADGRETKPHITVKYGLHTENADAVANILANEPPIRATIGKVSIFPAKEGTDYDVVKMDVDSPDLHRLNAKIAAETKVTDTHPEYKPHVTLAYVKPGEGAKYAGQSNALSGKEITLNKVLFSGRGGQEAEISLTGKPRDIIPDAEITLKPAESRRSTPRLNPTTDSLERAIRSLGGIKDDGSGEVSTLKESGLRGLVSSDGRSAEDMAMALAEHGYGRGVWWEGSLRQGDSSFSGVNANDFIAAAIEDATGSKKHYSNAIEMDFSAAEEQHWRSQMEPAELAQWDASQQFLKSRKAQRLLGEIENGKGTRKKLRELRELGKRYGLEEDVINEHIRLAENKPAESNAERDRAVPREPKPAPGDEGRPLTGEFIDETGTLRDASGKALFMRDEIRSLWDKLRDRLRISPHGVKRKDNVITVGEEAAVSLIIADEEMPLMGWVGQFYTLKEAREMLERTENTRLHRNSPERVPDLEKIRNAVQDALREGHRSIVIGRPAAARHEAFHAAGFEQGAESPLGQRHKNLEALTKTPEYNTAARELLAMHYMNSAPILVEEIAARIADGKHKELGLTRKQAIDWMTKWFTSFADTHGAVSISQFKELARDAQKALATALNEAATREESRGDNQSLRGVQEGRETRAGPDDTPLFDLTKSKEPLIGIVDSAGTVQGEPDPTFEEKHEDLFYQVRTATAHIDKWRYLPAKKTVYWTDDALPSADQRHAVENWLDRKGYAVSKHATINDLPFTLGETLFSLVPPPKRQSKEALKRLEELAKARGQTVRPSVTPAITEAEPAKPKLTLIPPPARRKTGETAERSFPKTAEEAGFRGGNDRDYTVLTNQESMEQAHREIMKSGTSKAAADLLATEEPNAKDIAKGILLMQRFEAKQEIGRAVQIASHLSRKLTEAGQRIQAASVISRLSPEGVLLHAQRILKGKPLADEQAFVLVQQAKAVSDAEKLIAEIQNKRPDIFGPNGEILPRPNNKSGEPANARNSRKTGSGRTRTKIGTLADRLALMEQQARERMQSRAAATQAETAALPPKSERGSALRPEVIAADLADLVIIGTAKLARRGINTATWLSEMAREAPTLTRGDLRRLYKESFERYEQERKQFLRESRERGTARQVTKEGGDASALTPTDYDRIIADRLDAQTAARKARTELTRSFDDLNTGQVVRTLRNLRDVWNLSRSLITSLDLSAAGRQGKKGLVSHPIAWTRGVGRQFKALSTKQYERMVSEMELDPDYKYAVRFKLKLSTIAGTEEAFQSPLVEKIPWVRLSEHAYNTMLDTLRFGWFKAMLAKYRVADVNLDDLSLKEKFIQDATLINNFTGRGGGKTLDKISPTLSVVYFSPRFWASNLKVLSLPLDPRMYGERVAGKLGMQAYSKQARVDAWKTLFGFYGLVTAQIGLARLLGAVASFDPDDDDFIFNPDSADFLKVRFGNTHIDFSAGVQTHLRVAARLAKAFWMREYRKGKPRKSPLEIVGQYSRSKEAPGTALIHDLFFSDKKQTEHGQTGSDFAGQPVFLLGEPGTGTAKRIGSSAIAKRILPIVIADAFDAYADGVGWKELAGSAALATIGEGANTYKKRYSERAEKFPMQSELDRLKITINPPQRIKPGKYDSFKLETDDEYDARRRDEAESIKTSLQRLEGMSFYQKLNDEQREKAIRATIKAGREAVRYQQPAKQRQLEIQTAP
jgi:2'-5' RNA ligase